jgi:uncharacterized protein
MSVRLRAHHLLCALTYVGEGYTPEFVANFTAIIARLRGGEPLELVDGPDDICAALGGHAAGQHCQSADTRERDTRARDALGVCAVLDQQTVADLRARFARGEIRSACRGCSWHALCDEIAAREFSGTLL